jgi:hypothetical protein
LAAADEGLLIRSNIDVRTHNLRVSSELPEIGGITKLAIALHLGRTTTCGWQTQGRKMALDLALRWSWLVGVDLPGLFSGKIKPEELSIRPLPDSLDMPRKRIAPKRPSVPLDSSALYLAYLPGLLGVSGVLGFIPSPMRDLTPHSRTTLLYK